MKTVITFIEQNWKNGQMQSNTIVINHKGDETESDYDQFRIDHPDAIVLSLETYDQACA
jgi:hypothetical protein